MVGIGGTMAVRPWPDLMLTSYIGIRNDTDGEHNNIVYLFLNFV